MEATVVEATVAAVMVAVEMEVVEMEAGARAAAVRLPVTLFPRVRRVVLDIGKRVIFGRGIKAALIHCGARGGGELCRGTGAWQR